MKSLEHREKNNILFDLYSELLPQKKKNYFEDYYINDYSICEIAEKRKVTRQFVSLMINAAVKKLAYYEKKLGFQSKSEDIKKEIEVIYKELDKVRIGEKEKRKIKSLFEKIEKIIF